MEDSIYSYLHKDKDSKEHKYIPLEINKNITYVDNKFINKTNPKPKQDDQYEEWD